MSKSTVTKVERSPFSYRCFINKEFEKAVPTDTVTKQFHLELGEANQAVIVEDRPVDWVELANKDLDQVGLANVLKLAAKGMIDISSLGFKDSEALDLGELDPMNPESIKSTIASASSNTQKLEATAAKLGISVDELVNAVVKGTLADIISKANVAEETKEGE